MRLLVAIDGTDASDTALDYALDIAARLDASLLLTYAIEPPARATADGDGDGSDGTGEPENGNGNGNEDTRFVQDALEDARTTGDRLLHDAATRASVAGISAERRLVTGDPVDRISELAVEGSVDGIVVGHRHEVGHHEVVNSVAKGLIERSPVPVTVVP